MDLKRISSGHPLAAATVVVALGTLLTELPLKGLLEPSLGPRYADWLQGIVEQGGTTVIILIIGWALGLGGRIGFRAPASAKAALLGWPLFAFALLNASDWIEGKMVLAFDPLMVATLALLYLSTGLIEEGLFRGFLMGLFTRKWGTGRKGVVRAALVSSAFFSLLHVMNWVMGRYNAAAAISQMGFAFSFGVFFAALYARTGSLWPGILLHMAVDFAGNLDAFRPGALPRTETVLTKTPGEALVSFLICLPLLLIGLFYLRKEDCGKALPEGARQPGFTEPSADV
jgi:membrane protease YdiL (CAAX protease family)